MLMPSFWTSEIIGDYLSMCSSLYLSMSDFLKQGICCSGGLFPEGVEIAKIW